MKRRIKGPYDGPLKIPTVPSEVARAWSHVINNSLRKIRIHSPRKSGGHELSKLTMQYPEDFMKMISTEKTARQVVRTVE